MTKVTVILTTYNSEKTLQRTLDSIFNQTGINMDFTVELIVVDDCSTDNTLSILNHNKVNFRKTESNSGGPNKGRNIGLKICTGDYVCFIDHDDEWLPDKIGLQLKYINKVKIVTSGYIVEDSTTGQKRNNFDTCTDGHKYFPQNVTFLNKISKVNLAQKHYFGSIMMSKELKSILFEEKFGMIDFDWIARLFEGKDSIEVCAPLFIRYVDGPNLSLNENYRKNDFSFSLEYLNSIRHLYPKECTKGIKRLYGSLARYYYLVDKMELSRPLLLKSGLSLKTLLYYITSFAGSSVVKKHFNVFG